MAYFKPHIDETGIHTPPYTDIRDHLVDAAKRIFGDDIYLGNDSQDYELICEFAEMASDTNDLAIQTYNNRGPLTAIGTGLDGVVKYNGIRRKEETRSICPVILSGEPGTKIYSGIVADEDGMKWGVGDVVLPESGEIEVEAVCRHFGAVYADAGRINKIVTQTRGWLSVLNRVNATPGCSIEADPILRARQSISTANPSRTVLQGIVGGIAALPDVTRYRVYENDTNIPDENGIPGHSNSCVVEGGFDGEIARVIYLRKTPGSGTYGDVAVDIEPPQDEIDKPKPVCFWRPKYIDVHVLVQAKPLAGYVTQMAADIRDNVVRYLNSVTIGESLATSALYVPAMTATPVITAPLFSIHDLLIGMDPDNLSSDDLPIRFNEVTRGVPDHVRVELV